jgi:predicted DNA-binding transcriptional regulator YafY
VDDEEAIALVVGLRTAAVAAIEGIEDTTVGLMAKLDQILPDRVRRRIDALHGSVEVLSWASPTPPVPAATLTVLSQGCRDREEVRFDYRRRDGDESRRLVQPHQLVSAGRRWYLVAWDVRREDWRTFRVDRMETPTLSGARFEPRPLPAADAATFVAEGMRAVTREFDATVTVGGTAEELDAIARWFEAPPEPAGDGRSRMTLRGESWERLASMIAILAVSFDVDLEDAPEEVRHLVAGAAARMADA